MRQILKTLMPKWMLGFYRRCKAYFAAAIYGFPSERMVVIGVTGTKGKSSTANFIWAGLEACGWKTAMFSTANLRMHKEERPNPYHMTMPDPFALQRFLAEAAGAQCRVVVIETTSEGVVQERHRGINYDILVFTNLTPEHLEAHRGFLNYRRAKQVLFEGLTRGRRKTIGGEAVPKAIIANADSKEAEHFLKFPADLKLTFGFESPADIRGEDIAVRESGTAFHLNGENVELRLLGDFNAWNALPAFAVGRALGLNASSIKDGVEGLASIPGRMEMVAHEPFTVIVDYAHEPRSLSFLLGNIAKLKKNDARIILLFGATGGGRDKMKRPIMGEIAGKGADYVVVSNDDPFDEDPRTIIQEVAAGVLKAGKEKGVNFFEIEDRREGIKKAVALSRPGDWVALAGKGSEQSMIIKRKMIPWDDRRIVREILGGDR